MSEHGAHEDLPSVVEREAFGPRQPVDRLMCRRHRGMAQSRGKVTTRGRAAVLEDEPPDDGKGLCLRRGQIAIGHVDRVGAH